MTATYRLQLHAGFTFADAEAVAPYLGDLGVSHLYLSPVLQAVPGSAHGYDVLDHTRVSAELGGRDGLVSLAETARQHGLGLVVDVVPNHMALVAPEHANAPLWDVLTHGRGAAHAHWFDVDWDALDQRIGLPVLWESLDDVLAKGDLRLGEENGQQVLRYHDHVFPVADGTWDGDARADVATVLERQHYRLAGWRDRDEVLNYRRFFDVDSLIAVRVEEEDVFEATHAVLLDLNHRGLVEGFRIDHPDGLADPEGYLRRLRSRVRPGTAIWVEKILEGDELLPGWACDGTTGYDATKAVTAALVDRATAPALSFAWEAARRPAVPRRRRRRVQAPGGRRRAGPRAAPAAAPRRRGAPEGRPRAARRGRRRAARRVLGLPRLRATRRRGRRARPAADAATRSRPRARPAPTCRPSCSSSRTRPLRPIDEAGRDFAVRLQQTWGPVMAKGIEDTAFYRWHRLVALNEVGGDPDLLEIAAPEQMHAWAIHQQQNWPLGMTTLSTHDTKRSEDVRARLLAVAGDAESWGRCSDAFGDAARARDVDPPTAHLVWQTLAGVGEIDDDRLTSYLTKAMRESKQRTSWLDSDPEYEARVLDLAREANGPGRLGALVQTAIDHNAEAVRALVLGQKLLELTLPGVPDTYQGTELVDLSLVDPDNRRPVDYDDRRARLERLRDEPPRDLDDEKLLVTHRALSLRRELRACFGDLGDHQPLVGTSRHLVGFIRGGEVATLVTRAPKRLEVTGGWADATVMLPEGLWRDELTGVLYGGADNLLSDVFGTYPVALMRKLHLSVTPRLWAPRAGTVDLVTPAGRTPAPRSDGRLVDRRRHARRAGDRYGFSLDGGDPRPDPRGLRAARRAARPVGGGRHRLRVDRRRAGAACRSPGPSSTRRTSARSPPRARSTPRWSGCPTWSTSASPWSSCCRWRRTRARTAGGTTAWRRTPCTRRTAAPPPCSASSTPRTPTGSPCASTWSTTTSARTGTTSARSGPYFTDTHPTPWGQALNLDGPDSDEVRRWVLDNVRLWLRDFHVDGLRLDAVHELHDESALHLLEEMSREVDALAADDRPGAVAGRRVRPQRPAHRDAARPRRRGRRARAPRPVGRRRAPRAARRADRGDPGLLRGLRRPRRRCARRCGRRSSTTAPGRASAAGGTAGPSTPRPSRAGGSWRRCRPTTRSATARRATGCRCSWTTAGSPAAPRSC